jgi:hypothetical protein
MNTATTATEETSTVVLVDDVDTLTGDIEPGCGNDNPYN